MTNYTLNFNPDDLDWAKVNNQIPVIVQNYRSGVVLMQGFMNREALDKTLEIGKVTFYSRTKQRLWTKGEESRHYLNLKAITADCDNDCLLIAADPIGPTCHRGTERRTQNLPEPAEEGPFGAESDRRLRRSVRDHFLHHQPGRSDGKRGQPEADRHGFL